MTANTIVYYQEAPLDESQYAEIAAKFKIPFEAVYRCINVFAETGEIPVMAFSGTTRQRVKELSAALSLSPPTENTMSLTTPEEVLYSSEEESFEESEAAQALQVFQESDDPEESETNEEEEEADEVLNYAASSLMKTFSDPEGFFIIKDNGICIVNPKNPPSIEQSHVAISHALKLGELGKVIDDKSSYMIGSLVASMEDLHGEAFSISQVCPATEKAYNTIAQAVKTVRTFPNPISGLSYSHHQEMANNKIPKTKLRPDPMVTKKLLLNKAKTYKLGAKQLRSLCSVAKRMEDDTVIRNIRSHGQAMDLIIAYRGNRAQFLVYDQGEFVTFTDSVDSVHQGSIVINLKKLTATANGVVAEIKKLKKAPSDINDK